MKKNTLIKLALLILFIVAFNSLKAQTSSEKVHKEILETLKLWNTAASMANVDQAMLLFDNSDNIMLIGSDSGEVNKGKDQIRGWLTQIFEHASFSWEMNRIDIDYNGETAWLFVDGTMIVKFLKGETIKKPYRFSGIMVKKKKTWKWRLFDGSVPQSE